jgi:mediator of replication checkpoint protein 1
MEFSGLLNREAEEDGEEDSEQDNREANEEASDEETIPVPVRQHTLNRPRHVIDEDDSDDGSQKSKPSQSTLDDGMAAFGFDNANATSLGLTQMFAGTMADLQSQSQSAGGLNDDSEQDSLTFLRNVPMATLPDFDTIIANTSQDFIVPNSQVSTSQQKDESTTATEPPISLNLSQFKSQSQTAFSHTQLSDIPEPTQDVGFELSRSPAGLVAPPSTIDTVIMAVTESPIAKKRGRLLRRREAIPALSDIDEDEAAPSLDSGGDDGFEISANAFDVMRKTARKPPLVDDFDKKKSEAKGMVEEQAEESEDEYAGLGGQSDDESGGELDEEVAKMIDEGEVRVDERKIAAFYA